MHKSLPARLSRPGVSFRRLGLVSKIALTVVVLIVIVGIFAPLLTRYDPTRTGVGSVLMDGPSGKF
ncbi:MAG: hypothetical protein ACR2P2_05340, partial [Nakamurella sp.]